MKMSKILFLFQLAILFALLRSIDGLKSTIDDLMSLSSDRGDYIVGDEINLAISVRSHNKSIDVSLICVNADDRCNRVLGCTNCSTFTFVASSTNETKTLALKSKAASTLVLYLKDLSSNVSSENLLQISVGRTTFIKNIADVIGWIYFFAWSISFYPQIFLNFKRKNVSGLSFDFLALNITGFLFYAVYNVALFYGSSFQAEFHELFPFSQIPVEMNDVVFAVHAVAATLITIFQCLIYEREDQKISLTIVSLFSLFWILAGILVIVCSLDYITGLTFITLLSYFKLLITLIKYIPQAYFNYQRKSTIGWSIGNVLLDFTGGVFSILQIILLNYNFDDWYNITKNLSKFGLGLFSILFDVLFIVQHYVLYRDTDSVLLDSPDDNPTNFLNTEDQLAGIENLNINQSSSSSN